MTVIRICLVMFLVFLHAELQAQHQLTITVKKVPNTKGKISAALYNTADDFLKFDKVFDSTSSEAIEGETVLIFDNVPAGNYAIALFHDENNNGKMDTNFLGIPKEKVAFSKAKNENFWPTEL